MFHHLQSK